MEPANNYIVLNIREFLNDDDQRLGEEKLIQLLSEFSCPLQAEKRKAFDPVAISQSNEHK